MRRPLTYSCLVVLCVATFPATTPAKRIDAPRSTNFRMTSVPEESPLPTDLAGATRFSPATNDTFHLAYYNFNPGSEPDTQGWTSVDRTEQYGTFFHVADGTELDGGDFGRLNAIRGTKSMWCGAAPSSAPPLCGFSKLPGYGNRWDQVLRSKPFACDSVHICYKVRWDSEPGYDGTFVEYLDTAGNTWNPLPVNGGNITGYTGVGSADDCWGFAVPTGTTQIRFHFKSDGAWSDEDGLQDTDGAVIVDDIVVECYMSGVLDTMYVEDFEDEAPGALATSDGVWIAEPMATGYGDYAALHPGTGVLQEDQCVHNGSWIWGFFDDPAVTNYGCAGFPNQGAVPYGTPDGRYIDNEIWSPLIPYTGTGDQTVLTFDVYRDMAINTLIYYTWHVRSWSDGCPSPWRSVSFGYYGQSRNWVEERSPIGAFIDPGAESIQIALGVVDQCGAWCGVFGTGECHSHAPLFDNVRVDRVDVVGPQYTLRFVDMFQDNFAEDGTLTGVARADGANDIKPGDNPSILPADSLVATITGLGTDPYTGMGPRAYVWARVQDGGAGVAGTDMEASHTSDAFPHGSDYRAGNKRWPLVSSVVVGGATWYQLRMDTVFTTGGAVVKDRYCFDFNDVVFVPGDTIRYFLGALDAFGDPTYVSRDLDGQGQGFVITQDINECFASPMEFTILPAGGYKRGGDILYVDGSDDRGGPAELYYDTAFDYLILRDLVDRYDILAPSSGLSNGLAGRVKNVATQIMIPYRKIIWNSGNLSSALLGDGDTTPVKQDDFGLLYQFLNTHPSHPGLWISGDSNAQEWNTMGASATTMKAYMGFTLVNGNHTALGEPVSPTLTGVGPATTGLSHVAYGGCPVINDFDVLSTAGGAGTPVGEMQNTGSGQFYAMSQATPNSNSSVAKVFLQGYSFTYIRDLGAPAFPPARVAFMRAVLLWLDNIVPNPIGIKDQPKFVNRLDHNYPNPFNPTTTITYAIKTRGPVALTVYNVVGQRVRTLVSEVQAPRAEGFTVDWDGRTDAGAPVASGVYFYKLTTKEFSATKKMVLLK
jgi:hypothetical protein